jgi:L-lactate dehydrogenase
MAQHHQKIVLVGDGGVGSAYAFALMQQGLAEELVIIDVNAEAAEGDAMDLEDAAAWTSNKTVRSGDYSDTKDADLVVITAGFGRKPGETRLDLVGKNLAVMKDVTNSVMAAGFNGIFLIATNPVDIMTMAVREISGFPPHRVIGTGTALDSARLRVEIAKRLQVSPSSVNALVLGEHGDSEFINWSSAMIGSQPLVDWLDEVGISQAELADITETTVFKGREIIARKGATIYGVATSLMRITMAIFRDERAVLPVSAYVDGEYGLHNMYIGTAAVIGAVGVERVVEAKLNPDEQQRMSASAKTLVDVAESVGIKMQ